jgi:tight adherence protein C
MPYVYDLIVMALRSGISIPEALRRVTKDYEHEPIGEELGHVLHEVRLGTPRREALQHMAARIDVPELHQFVQSILQAEELGRPVAEALDRVAGQARTRRWQMIEKKANSAGVMIAVPSMLILIGNLLLLMGPFVLRILDSAREVM